MMVLVKLTLILFFIITSACKHIGSDLSQTEGDAGPHELSDPSGDDWQNPKDGGFGTRSGQNVDVDPKSKPQEVSGASPENRPLVVEIDSPRRLPEIPVEGAMDVPPNATNIKKSSDPAFDTLTYDFNNFRISVICTNGRCYGAKLPYADESREGSVTGEISGDESKDYPSPRPYPSVNAKDPNAPSNKNPPSTAPSNKGQPPSAPRSGNLSSYNRRYSSFDDLKRDIESKEEEHTKEISEGLGDIKKDHSDEDVPGKIKDFVKEHNKVVSKVIGKQPLVDALLQPSDANQRTPPDSIEGKKVGIAKGYIRNVREGVDSGRLKSHERSKDFLDFADELVDVGDRLYSEGYKAEGDKAVSTGMRAADLATDFTPGISLAKDIISLMTGVNPVTGEVLSDTERALIAATMVMPTAFSAGAKVAARAAKAASKIAKSGPLLKGGSKNGPIRETLSKPFDDLSKALTSPKHKKLLDDLGNLPGGRHIRRVRPGTNDKIAIIGRPMGGDDGIDAIAKDLRQKGYDVETFSGKAISEEATNEWLNLSDQAKKNGGLLTTQQAKETLMFKENIGWAERIKREGHTVLDATDNNRGFSTFYAYEKELFFGD
jgi:hypothetical protein